MARRLALFLATFLASLVASLAAVGTAALAQSPLCDRYRAELASLPQGGDPRAGQYEAQARRLRAELARAQGYYQQLGCGRGFLFFEAQNPPQCAGVQARVEQLQAQYAQAAQNAQIAGGGAEQRRRQLLAAIDRNCRGAPVEARRPNFFEQLFGVRPSEEVPQEAGIPRVPDDQSLDAPLQEERPRSYGGSRVVCVRTCDGYFFPLPTGVRDGAGDMCQALCPATETLVYFMSPSGRIENAGNREGKPYTELANAGRYKRAFDPACGCRKPGESWAQALQHAEELLGNRRNDLIVTAEKAEELSRPKVDARADARKPNPKDAKAPARAPAPPSTAADTLDVPEGESPADQASVPTATGESSGIGPKTIATEQTVSQREGQLREVISADGKRQKVRVVAPNIFAAPESEAKSR